jgi:diacylglycerol kinase family enzyme
MGYHLTFTIDGTETFEGEYLLCTVANGSFCGGGWHSSPRAHMNDGLLELAIVKKLPRRKLLPIIPSYHSGKYLDKHIQTGVVTYRQCKSLQIVAARPQNVSIDGEIVPFTVLAIQNLPGALRVIIPAGTNFKNP